MKRAAAYVRVSSAQQVKEGDSIPAQRAALKKYIDDRPDLVLADEYIDDGISGTRPDRDELQRLLSDVEGGKVDIILVCKLDRLYRSIRHYLNMMDLLDKYGVGWLAIWEPVYDTTTPAGRLIVNQMMSFAQFEAEITGQRISQVFQYKVGQGEVITGNPPAGYKIENKHLVPGEYAGSIRQAYEIFASTGSLNAVTRAQLPGLPQTHSGIKRIIKNRIYVGEYRNNLSYCPPLVDYELWDECQKLLCSPIKSNVRHEYIFSGLLKCAECGCSLGGNTRKRDNKLIQQYRCPRHYNHKPALCPNPKVLNETVLEKYMVDNVNDLLGEAKLNYQLVSERANKNTKKIDVITKRLDRLKALYLDEIITASEYKADRQELEAELEKLQALELPANPQKIADRFPDNFPELYATFTPAEKRRFWHYVIKEIRFSSDRKIDVVFSGGTN